MRYYFKIGNKWSWLWKGDPYTEPTWYYDTKKEAVDASLKCKVGSYTTKKS